MNLQIPIENFSDKSAFEPGLPILQETYFVSNSMFFPELSPNPCTRVCVSTTGSLSIFARTLAEKSIWGIWLLDLAPPT